MSTFKFRRVLPAVLALAVCLIAAPAALAETCTSSVPASNFVTDSASDAENGVSPELTALRVSIDGACRFTASYDVFGQTGLVPGEFYSWFIDSDNNDATGSQGGFVGADYSIGMSDDGIPMLLRWNGTNWVDGVTISRAGTFGARASLNQIGAASGRTIWFSGGASWTSPATDIDYFDFIPSWVGLNPIFPAPSTGGDTGDGGTSGKRCIVPRVRGLSLSAAKRKIRNAHCKVGKIRKVKKRKYAGRVVKTSPGAGARRPAGTKVTIYVGKGARRSSTASILRADRVAELINEIDSQRP
jgi:hypothetical protein